MFRALLNLPELEDSIWLPLESKESFDNIASHFNNNNNKKSNLIPQVDSKKDI